MSAPSDAALVRRLRLRGRLPSPVRLSRRTLIAVGAAVGVGLAGVIAWSLAPHHRRPAAEPQAAEVTAAAPPAALARLPADYAALPSFRPRRRTSRSSDRRFRATWAGRSWPPRAGRAAAPNLRRRPRPRRAASSPPDSRRPSRRRAPRHRWS